MQPIKIIFTGTLSDKTRLDILKSYSNFQIKQFQLINFVSQLDQSNLNQWLNDVNASKYICLTSKVAVDMIAAHQEMIQALSKKQLLVSGKMTALHIEKKLGLNATFSSRNQGQQSIIDVLSEKNNLTDETVCYFHSNRADTKLKEYLEKENIKAKLKTLYHIEYSEIQSKALLKELDNQDEYKALVFFGSPSSVEAYKSIQLNQSSNILYLAFGESTFEACKNSNISAFFKKDSKTYFDTVEAYVSNIGIRKN